MRFALLQFITNGRHVDGACSSAEIDFVYFLACEVGGSKYLFGHDQDSVQIRILRYNMQMYEVVWPWVQSRGIPTVFVSSQLSNEHIPYGTVKRVGESWAEEHGNARTVQLWNVYGKEKDGIKSHVVNDWISSCLARGHVAPRSNGKESRQFLHTDEAAASFVHMAENWTAVPQYMHLTTGKWTTLRELALELNAAFREEGLAACEFHWPETAARGNLQRRTPNMTSTFHMNVESVAVRVAAILGKPPASVSADDVQSVVSSGQQHELGHLGLRQGLRRTIRQIQAQLDHTAGASHTEL